ncbi:IQ calmodulin-binding motif domain containing protein [Acanthamoeba castellanii str. Neff]|uniref:IQ calmodulin-binding motif domain containing protein n=1 Tax=Acanthamoeba castellanii (strain ATCC 30010 / Neff) TaxID=1257118 RepID=L8H0Q9_ACACF|nr:IQ calmodulin-binding motif domain containing protein [Acanthamoeba castellanii str. Neff]ELR18358.1 IQ calmodulin-binding motif domain containing protein [Acanthamoeba castellanii str. Neff]
MHAKRRAAAVRIQARWRGCLARKAFKPLWSSRHLAKLRPVESAPLSHLQLGKPAPNSPTIRRRTPSRGHHKKTKSITRNEAACLISTEAEEPPAPAPSAAKPAVGHVERAATPPAPVAVAVAGATPKEQKTSEPGVEEPKRIRLVPLGAPGFAFDPTQVTLRKAPVTRPEGGAAGSPGGAVAMANLRESLKKPLGQDEPVKTGMVSEEESSVLKVLRRHSAQDMKTLLVPKQDTGTVLRRKASREAPDDLSRSASHFTFALPSTEARVAALHQSLGGARPTPVVPMAKMVSNDLFSSANLPKRVSFSKNASPRSTVNLRGRQPGAAESPSGLAGQPTLQDTTEAAKLQANVAAGQTQHFDSPLPSLESSPSGSPSEGSPIAARLSSPMPQRPLGAPPATPPTPASSASVFTPAHPRTKSGSFAPLMGRRGALMGSTSSIASSSASAQPHDWPQRRKSASELLLVFFKKRKTKEELIERGIFVEVDGEPGGDQVGRLQAQRECTVCKESVRASLFKSQHKVCPRCKASVCKKCVTKRKYPLPGWKDKRAVCLLCLPEVDKTFE